VFRDAYGLSEKRRLERASLREKFEYWPGQSGAQPRKLLKTIKTRLVLINEDIGRLAAKLAEPADAEEATRIAEAVSDLKNLVALVGPEQGEKGGALRTFISFVEVMTIEYLLVSFPELSKIGAARIVVSMNRAARGGGDDLDFDDEVANLSKRYTRQIDSKRIIWT